MEKFAKELQKLFTSGQIDSDLYSYLKTSSKISIQKLAILQDYQVASTKEFEKYSMAYDNIHAVCAGLGITLSKSMVKDILDLFYQKKYKNAMQATLDYIKMAYPNEERSYKAHKKTDIEMWVETMRKVYELAQSPAISFDDALDQMTQDWKKPDKNNFIAWVKYYNKGDHLRYNTNMFKKESQYLQTGNPFLKPKPAMEEAVNDEETPKSPEEQREEERKSFYKKLLSRITSIRDLLYNKYRHVLTQETVRDMTSVLRSLEDQLVGLRTASMMQDCIYRSANRMVKNGFFEGGEELKKIAQQLDNAPNPPQPMPAATPATPESMPPVPPADLGATTPAEDIKTPEVDIGNDIAMPDFNQADVKNALAKLEEVNKVISERNLIRALAAVDIILGQMGIAAFFPDLSEAQAKLMDAFNYSGTRIAKVIGQLRGGQNITPGATPGPAGGDVVEVVEEQKPTQPGTPIPAPSPEVPVPAVKPTNPPGTPIR